MTNEKKLRRAHRAGVRRMRNMSDAQREKLLGKVGLDLLEARLHGTGPIAQAEAMHKLMQRREAGQEATPKQNAETVEAVLGMMGIPVHVECVEDDEDNGGDGNGNVN